MSAAPIRRAIHSDRFPTPVASYSQGFQLDRMLFITGQLPVDPTTNLKVGDGDITLESRQVMRNMQAVLEEAGFGFEDVVSATVYLTDIDKLDSFDAVWQEYFPNPQAYPSRAVVEVSALVLGIQLEISAIAIKD
ncbi:MAG: hypothetical protein EBX49_05285 [Synechococcaceae bacterium WB8_1B_136]|nr:hypothetical protein [Synechococcaceae bacterium WB8_1B_136]